MRTGDVPLMARILGAWREEDAEAAAENRRRAALKEKLTPSLRTIEKPSTEGSFDDAPRPKLSGWRVQSRRDAQRICREPYPLAVFNSAFLSGQIDVGAIEAAATTENAEVSAAAATWP